MRRPILIALLTLTTIGGYASGFMHLRHNGWCHRDPQSFERHIAEICSEAAIKANATKTTPPGN